MVKGLLAGLWMASIMLGALFVGVQPDGLAAELTNEALASPDARVEMSQIMARKLTDQAPILARVSDLDEFILATMNSPVLETALPIWMEHSVRFRMGEDVGALMVVPGDIIETDSEVLNLGIRALPALPVELAPKWHDMVVPALKIAAPVVLVAAVALTVLAVRRRGWAGGAAPVGLGGFLGIAGLLILRLAAELHGELSSIVASAVVPAINLGLIAAAGGAIILAVVFAQQQDAAQPANPLP